MVHHPEAPGLRGFQQIEMLFGDVQVGRLNYEVCHECRIGYIAKLSVDFELEGRGLGARALKLARDQAPGCRWCTSGQYDTAQSFWRQVSRRTGGQYQPAGENLSRCTHMKN